ncbi:MAG: SDR family NAD(P)-dependent oxidoreductase [Planctomycetaceae bacterium]|nr:SDR family NAD(P)-dependent oxidoreductase [Planctomycetaceae bacterium]
MIESGSSKAPPVPLAFVGLSCLFPKADGGEEFWSNIRRGVDAITEVPSSHWRPDDYFDPDPKSPDMTYARRGGFLSPIPFDPLEFGIAPSNLEAIDTSQLLGLVAAKRALEDAGYGLGGKPLDRSRVACILGVTGTLEMVIPLGARLGHPKWRQALREAGVPDDVAADVIARISESYVPWQENSFPGLLGNVVAGRIANRLDLGGTNCVVDAACASSLSALHLAALELWSGRSDMVLTGGVDTFNDIFMYMCFSKTPALSPTGDARPFADNADGTILGEGVGVFALKRLTDAQRDGDRIYSLLRGIGTSSDGAGNAVYAPKKDGQIRCIDDAYQIAGVAPETIELVEAHGTGTKVGDATEVAGLNEVYRRSGRAGRWCALGSVKSQIGHTKAAAGAAGVLKAILSLQHRVLPPTIKVDRPQDVLLADDSPFYVSTQSRPWMASADHPRRAGVSAFGFGGSNFHCVLEEAPQPNRVPDWDGDVVVAAFSGTTLEELKEQLAAWKSPQSWSMTRSQAAASRATFQRGREHRLLFVWEQGRSNVVELISNAESLLDKYADRQQWSTPDGIIYGRGPCSGKLAVLFPGQGSQTVGMLRELACRFPVMQDVLAEANAAFADCNESSDAPRLSDCIYPPPAWTNAAREQQEATLRATDIAQPAIGAVSLGALAVLQQFGVVAELTAGHSYGELTALCASRRYQPAALYRLSTLRGRLMAAAQEVDGGMLAVGASLTQVEQAIAECAVDLVVANRNSPNQIVLSGRLPDIERAVELFSRRNLRGKKLPVAAAFHSPLVAAASAKFRPVLDDIDFAPSDVPVYANSNAGMYPDDPSEARDLLAGQLAKPVEFVQQIENMYAAGARCFLEVGPGSVLTGLVGSILTGRDFRAVSIDASAGKRSGMFDLAMVLAQLGAAGQCVDLTGWDPAPPIAEVPGDRLTIPLSGANYVKPRAPRPARPPMLPVAAPAHVPPAPLPPVPAPAMTTAPALNGTAPMADQFAPQLAILAKMQEETARLHRQFLEGQESALRTLASYLGGTSSAMPVTPPPAQRFPASPAPAPAPLPATARTALKPALRPEAQAPENRHVPTPPTALTHPAVNELAPQVLAVVAEKTGYPVEMLRPAMSLDHDLGIDSIKRVEILSALQEKLPQLPTVTPEQLQTLHRLQDVIDLLGMPESSLALPKHGNVASPPADSATADLSPRVLAVVAEKTGYPVEMLKPAMSLDHDLGIDSIKRVEILSALQETLPQLPAVTPEQLQTLHRLQDVIDLLGASSSPPPRQVALAAAVKDLAPQVLAVVAEKTGYPVEMLKPAMSLDHDLGIDSIKRVEILSALQEKLPQLPTVTPEQLQTLHRLQDVIDLLGATSAPADSADTVELVAASTPSTVNVDDAVDAYAPISPAPDLDLSELMCGVVVATPAVASPRAGIALPAGGELWITDDGSQLPLELAARLTQAGFRSRVVQLDEPTAPSANLTFAGLILLAPQLGISDAQLWRTLEWTQKAGPALRNTARQGTAAVFMTVARLDGGFGLSGDGALTDIASGGLAGLSKTVRHEWPELTCKALDLAADLTIEAAADLIITELLHEGPMECGLSTSGRVHVEVELQPMAPHDSSAAPLSPGDLLIVTGGARGVTAAAAVAVARKWKPALVLLGRSPAPQPEPEYLRGVDDATHIKQALATHGAASTPRALQMQCQQVLANREIEATLQALRATGAHAEYRSVDVRDISSVCQLVEELQRRHGPVRGLIHGAGVLADHRIEHKTREQFDSVFSTKIVGLRNVLGAISPEALRCLVLFSSFTARYGRTGQVDYAIANEVLNKHAQQWQRRHPGCRVISFNWGPWDGGMVQGGLKSLFAQEGVGLIPLEAGAELVVAELQRPTPAAVEVVVLGPGSRTLSATSAAEKLGDAAAEPSSAIPADARLAFHREISVSAAPYLSSHMLGKKGVLPVAMMVEWLAHGVMHRNPGLDFQGLDGLRVLKGVRLDREEVTALEVHVGKPRRSNGNFIVSSYLASTTSGRQELHAAADIVLGTGHAEEPPPSPAVHGDDACAVVRPYDLLFHGPMFQGIDAVEHCSSGGIVVWSRTAATPAEWTQQPFRNAWLADPLALDVTLQALIVWSRTIHGTPSLPAAVGRYRQYRRSFPTNGVRISARITSLSQHRFQANVEFIDQSGRVVAVMEDVVHILNPLLANAFALNAW